MVRMEVKSVDERWRKVVEGWLVRRVARASAECVGRPELNFQSSAGCSVAASSLNYRLVGLGPNGDGVWRIHPGAYRMSRNPTGRRWIDGDRQLGTQNLLGWLWSLVLVTRSSKFRSLCPAIK